MIDVRLRRVEEGDLQFLADLSNEPSVRNNVVGWDFPLSRAGQESWFHSQLNDKQGVKFVVELLDSTPIGLTGLWNIDWRNRTAGTALKVGGPNQIRGHGYGTKAIAEIMSFAFNDVGLHKLTASILCTNTASLTAYIRKSGWSEEGRQLKQVWRDGEHRDLILIGMLRETYLEGNQTVPNGGQSPSRLPSP